jgi:putative FmdB family regulatory protein
MPFYEYQCKSCGHTLEAMQKVNDSPLKKCPDCGKSQLMRLMSAPVFRLKGGGWYETDFKSDKENKRNLAGAEKEESRGESKGESKPEAKEAKPAEAKTPAAEPADSKRSVATSARKHARPAPTKAKGKAHPKPKAKGKTAARKARR